MRNVLGLGFCALALALTAKADTQLILNGGFETNLTSWTVTSSADSFGSWFQNTGDFTPLTFNLTVGADSGTGYAVTDQYGPGVNALSQGYTVPLGTTKLTLTFDMFINDWLGTSGTADIQVLILGAGGNPVTGAGTVATLFSGDTQVVDGNPNPYVAYSYNLTGLVPGDSYTLDFLETDTVANMNVGLDNVSLVATPEPTSIALLLGIIAAIGVFNRRRLGFIRQYANLVFALAAIALFSHSAYAQNLNIGFPVVPPGSVGPDESRPHLWTMAVGSPAALVHGPGQTSCGAAAGQNACYYIPSDITTAYALAGIPLANGGAGMTVAIVDAYYNSQTVADLAIYVSAMNGIFGQTLPQMDGVGSDPTLTIVGQTGGAPPAQPGTLTATIQGWFDEEDLDVQWVHSIAPNANILLVIANSPSNANLYQAVQTAKNAAGVVVVTDSWGGSEGSGETTVDADFLSNVPILFSAGDTFAITEYPCTSPNVTCVGGTHLLETAASTRSVEGSWDEPDGGGGTGGGCSPYEAEPAFQVGYSTCGSKRGVPDIAAIADEYTGVLVFLGTNAGGTGDDLYLFGGTSLASPVMAAVIANIDASRLAHGKSIIGGSNTAFNLTTALYDAAANPFYHYRFYDVTTGGGAAAGWDTATGLGVTLNPALTAYLLSLP